MVDRRVTINGKQTFELAQEKKDDLAMMLRCCEIEIEEMLHTGLIAAHVYCERAAILYRKGRCYADEIAVCGER